MKYQSNLNIVPTPNDRDGTGQFHIIGRNSKCCWIPVDSLENMWVVSLK